MRYMIHDSALGFIVKDTDKGEQCQYKSDQNAAVAVRNGIGKTEYEAMRREVLVPIPEVELREHVRILQEACWHALGCLEDGPCTIDPKAAIQRLRDALNATGDEV